MKLDLSNKSLRKIETNLLSTATCDNDDEHLMTNDSIDTVIFDNNSIHKLENLDHRMDKLESHIVDIKDSLGRVGGEGNKTIITIGVSVFGIVLTALLGLIVHLILK
jgi:hypothetical protein